jgi:hypothetical protein
MLGNPVAVEKLPQQQFTEISSCQETLQTIFPSLPALFLFREQVQPIGTLLSADSTFFRKTDFFNCHPVRNA